MGISILIILFSNSIDYWFIFGPFSTPILILISILDVFGPFFYLFLVSYSVTFTLNKKMGCNPEKSNRNKVLKEALFLIFLGFILNLILVPFSFWGWNILMFLGFSQIICVLSFKIVRWGRIIIALSIIFLSAGIRELLFIGKSNPFIHVLHFILVSPIPNYSLFPYASLSLFSTVFSELIHEGTLLESDQAELRSVKSIIKYGVIFIFIGFIIPFFELNPLLTIDNFSLDIYPFFDGISIINSSFIYYFPMPHFLIKGVPGNIFFIMGTSLVLIGINYRHFNSKLRKGIFIESVCSFGTFSLTLILIQYLFLFVLFRKINIFFIIPVSLLYLVILTFLVNIWKKKVNTVLSIDWMVKKLSGKNPEDVI